MSNRRITLAIMLSVGIGGLGWLAAALYHYATVTVPDAYAVEWVAGMVIRYMESHEGAWPSGWDDLRGPYDQVVREAGGRPWTFEELRRRVAVDWTADPASLVRAEPVADSPPFRVIWLRDGKSVYWSGKEPNRLIWEYLGQKLGTAGRGTP
jgi:hypothetical protein